MPFDLRSYAHLRPYLYHLTDAANLPEIQRSHTLIAALGLMKRAGRGDLQDVRRSAHVPLTSGGSVAVLRDQAPLHARNMRLEDGCSFSGFVSSLNERVFFWPGNERGPIDYGQRHFARYESEQPIVIRVECEVLLALNPERVPFFCKYNSGSPRWSGGVPSPRGTSTFLTCEQALFGASSVVEVSFRDAVSLPRAATYIATEWTGPWQSLADSKHV